MMTKPYLMVPGPTVVPDRVLQAMHRPMINHRGPQYEAMFAEIVQGMQQIIVTKHDILVYPAAGTGMMEAAVVNLLSPGDKVLALSIGVFGDRFADIAGKFGAVVEKMEFPWGQAACPEKLAQRLAGDVNKEIKVILVTHNETSTGVTNNVAALAKAKGDHPAILVVDAVSSLGAIELKMDEWGIDAVISGSQKGMMIPPGLGFMVLNDKAWRANEKSSMPKYYWDAQKIKKSLLKNQNPYTPPISLLFGLQEALKIMQEEGSQAIYARHRLLAKALRSGVKALGLKLLADDEAASTVVTAVVAPEGCEAKKIQKLMREDYGITIAGGQQTLENKIFRIGHLGYASCVDILVVLATLELALYKAGIKVDLGQGVRAAQEAILE